MLKCFIFFHEAFISQRILSQLRTQQLFEDLRAKPLSLPGRINDRLCTREGNLTLDYRGCRIKRRTVPVGFLLITWYTCFQTQASNTPY